MKTLGSNLPAWWTVFVLAAAMALAESAAEHYPQMRLDRVEPYQPNPLPLIGTGNGIFWRGRVN